MRKQPQYVGCYRHILWFVWEMSGLFQRLSCPENRYLHDDSFVVTVEVADMFVFVSRQNIRKHRDELVVQRDGSIDLSLPR